MDVRGIIVESMGVGLSIRQSIRMCDVLGDGKTAETCTAIYTS